MSRNILSLKNVTLALAAAALTAMTTGCANMATTAGDGNSFSTPGTMSGTLYGGNLPIANSTVKLYAVGTTGYGSAGTLLATTTTSTDGHATFQFTQATTGGPYSNTGSTYLCPASNTLIYIIASGGDPISSGTNNNTAAVFLAALGACGSSGGLNIVINEVTSVASIWALQQYINPGATSGATTSVGSPNTTQAKLGISNAFATVANMVNMSTGVAVTSSTNTASGTNIPTATVTITPETAKINTIANILAACVNNATAAATNCSTLFGNVAVPTPAFTSQPSATFPSSGDTLQAAYYMAVYPTNGGTSNLANVYALSAASGAPFQPTLSGVPTDWTVAITYSAPTSTSICASGGPFLDYGYQIGVDAQGNIWVANGGVTASGTISEMSPVGKPLACTEIAIGSERGGAVIDTAGNVWATSNNSAFVYKFNGTTTTAIPVPGTGTHTYGIAADGSGNVFFTDAVNLKLYELPSTATAATTPTLIGTVTGASPFTVGVDPRGTVVVGQSGSGGATITGFPLTTVGGTTYGAAQNLTQSSAYAGVYGIAFDSNNNFWIGNSAGSSGTGTAPGNTTSATPVTYSTSTPNAAVTATFGTPTNITGIFAGGISTARAVAVDGANMIWMPSNTAASSGLYGVAQFAPSGFALSPTSTTGTTTVTQNGGYQKAATVFAGLRGLAIDPSGNVWVTNTASTSNNWITEMVGAAVPVVTPLSAALAANQLGTKP